MRTFKEVEIKCRWCGKSFMGHTNRRYCSHECRSKYDTLHRKEGNMIYISPEKNLTPEEREVEREKNRTFAERQKAKTLALLPKIGEL